jgi:hypothetical protein
MQLATEELLVHEVKGTSTDTESQSAAVMKTPEDLANIVSQFLSSDGWIDRVVLGSGMRFLSLDHANPVSALTSWPNVRVADEH